MDHVGEDPSLVVSEVKGERIGEGGEGVDVGGAHNTDRIFAGRR